MRLGAEHDVVGGTFLAYSDSPVQGMVVRDSCHSRRVER